MNDQVADLIKAGFALCRIHSGEKRPVDKGWQLSPIRSTAAFADGPWQVGIVCGPLSRGCVCVDLDGVDAEFADQHLPPTGMEDGRPGRERAHRWFQITDQDFDDTVLPGRGSQTRVAMGAGILPRFPGSRNLRCATNAAIGVEFKGAGTQATVPPTITATGRRTWTGGVRGEPAAVAYSELITAVEALALAIGWTTQAGGCGGDGARLRARISALRLADWDVLARARGARNGNRFQALWDGTDVHSEADAALCAMLAFWSRDALQIERLWLSSPAGQRVKTQDRADYRHRTIAFVLGTP